ncbi:hypothetical protein GCM10008941_12470 [Rhizomicrobium palustre]
MPWLMFLFLACPLPQMGMAQSSVALVQIVSLQKSLRAKMLIAARDIQAFQPFSHLNDR